MPRKLLGLPQIKNSPSHFRLVPNLTLQWAKDMQPLENKGFLAPGRYQLFTASRDRVHGFSYTAQGTIYLCPDGVCTGRTVELSRRLMNHHGNHAGLHDDDDDDDDGAEDGTVPISSQIKNGRWTLDGIRFQYMYGRSYYNYVVHLVSVTHTSLLESRPNNNSNPALSSLSRYCALPTAHLTGTWDSCSPFSNPTTEHGTVDQMLIVGHGLGVCLTAAP